MTYIPQKIGTLASTLKSLKRYVTTTKMSNMIESILLVISAHSWNKRPPWSQICNKPKFLLWSKNRKVETEGDHRLVRLACRDYKEWQSCKDKGHQINDQELSNPHQIKSKLRSKRKIWRCYRCRNWAAKGTLFNWCHRLRVSPKMKFKIERTHF